MSYTYIPPNSGNSARDERAKKRAIERSHQLASNSQVKLVSHTRKDPFDIRQYLRQRPEVHQVGETLL